MLYTPFHARMLLRTSTTELCLKIVLELSSVNTLRFFLCQRVVLEVVDVQQQQQQRG